MPPRKVRSRSLAARWTRRCAAAGAAVAVLAAVSTTVLSGRSQAEAPIDGGDLALVPVAINTGPGNQTDPHVSGDLVSYTGDESGAKLIHYYNFATDTDAVVPPANSEGDSLSDVSAGRIAFSRAEPDGSVPILVYDVASGTTTEIQPELVFPDRMGVAIGGPLVALVDRQPGNHGDLVLAEIGGGVVQLTSDSRVDRRPSVSPRGDYVVWESCEADTFPSGCVFTLASQQNGVWFPMRYEPGYALFNPDTDGVWVVFDTPGTSGDQDIFRMRLADGDWVGLPLPGVQRNPSVKAGVIVFESVAPEAAMADLYVYAIASNTYYRVTNTPTQDERLSDIDALPDGRIRLVWAVVESGGLGDVMGATFMLPSNPSFQFGGLLQPVDPWPTLNAMKAGAAVPVRFSLGGPQGLAVFAAGYPRSEETICDSTAPVNGIEQTVAAGGSALTYDGTTDTYAYTWKTDRAWAGTCRQLVLKFTDGTTERALFQFK